MRKNYLFFALCALFLFIITPHAYATVLLNEHFNQATETLATNDNAFLNEIAATGWTNINGSGQTFMSLTNLSYSGYKSTPDTEGGSVEYKATFGKKVATPLSSNITSGNIYAAAIMDISDVGATSRDYNFALCTGTSSLATATNQFARLHIQKGTSSGFRIAIAKGAEGNTAYLRWSGDLAFGKYLVVIEYQFISGNNNDVVNLYMNPVKGDKPSPTLTCVQDTIRVSDSQHYGASLVADASGLKSVMLYSSSTNKAALKLDELKVVTDWADLWEAGEDPDPEPVIGVPEPEASDVTISSASIAWDAVEGADSYVLQWKVNGGSYSDDIEINKDVRSYSMTGLESETKYFVRVKTIIGEDESEWATINFTTEAEPDILVYKEISFDKYSTQDAMPTSGTVYLAKNVVEYGSGDPLTTTLSGNLTLNLHGKQLFMYGGHIVVPSGVTFTIYDDAGTGEITGGYAGSYVDRGIISVKEGGTLIIGEGGVINQDDAYEQVAIHNNGILKISGAPVISGNRTDIYLGSSITIESGKPLTNSTPYKVYKATGSSFTSGWANMSGESPKDYFSSTNVGNGGVCLNASGEAQIVPALSLSESSTNTSIGSNSGQLVNASFTRSLVSSQYNTFCLPFALNNAELQEIFGAGYDLRQLESSSFDGEMLNLVFSDPLDALEAGKPYLIQPSQNVVNPSFEGVTITAISPINVVTSYVDFKGNYAPTELTKDNKNQLFLDAGNELKYPVATANLKGFRAYFEVKGAAQQAVRARIVKGEEADQALDQTSQEPIANSQKLIKDGQLIIERNGTLYNAQGQVIK